MLGKGKPDRNGIWQAKSLMNEKGNRFPSGRMS
jgi:hypothetical protein